MKKLLDIMADLRNPKTGCPWDVKQTFNSIIPYTIEEAYEVADAIESGDMNELKSELGDLLFQVVFYAQMAKEKGSFDFDDVVNAVSEKLVNRHPHVFADIICKDETELHEAWEKSKATERNQQAKTKKASILDGVAKALPALKRAQKLQKRAAREGFDWPSIDPVINKIEEEMHELREAMQQKDSESIFEETGDLIFSCVNLARHLNVDAEESLRGCNKKFEKRFSFIEKTIETSSREFKDYSLDELESLWQEAKQK
jgi:nucleoside triphosphate diphosphatase